MEKNYGIDRKCFSILSNHARLDKKHIQENTEMLEALEKTGRYDFDQILEDLQKLADLGRGFYADVAALQEDLIPASGQREATHASV